MRKIFRTILAVVLFAAIILAGCETPDGGISFWWTAMWICVAFIAAGILDKTSTNTNKSHEREH